MQARRRITRDVLVASLVILALATDGAVTPSGASTRTVHRPAPPNRRTSAGSGVVRWAGAPVTTTAIPLGDGKISSSPRTGDEDSCVQSFPSGGAGAGGGPPGGGGGGGGASAIVPWIDTVAGTWNLLDATGRDAGAHEVQDSCDGHPQMSGIYHYHDYSTCLDTAATKMAGSSILVGYALDGYGIYVERDASGRLPTDADLDACHGRTSRVLWNGKESVVYHYDVTLEYPYLVGCFHGAPVTGTR